MKTKLFAVWAWILLGALNFHPTAALAQGTAFTYQGRLSTGGSPANGNYDFIFTLWSTNSGGGEIGGALTNAGVGVANGLFTATLDFGSGISMGQPCWLEVNVETNGGGPYVTLTPRQALTPTPYAVYAESSGGVTNASISAVQLNTPGAPSSGQVLSFNGSSLEWTSPAAGASGWSLTGNAGTSPGSDFLGTTDNQPLELVVNNIKGIELSPEANNTVSLSVGPGAAYGLGAQGVAVFGGYYGGVNLVYANYSTIAGGYNNLIGSGAPAAFIAGGAGNVINGNTSAIGGGYNNTVNGLGGAIPGGCNNLVAGSFGFAAGNGAQVMNSGSFVWADNSGGTFASTVNNQFSVRATGGVNFVTGGAGLKIDGQAVSTSGGGGGSGTSWSLTGNAGTVPGMNFLGTTDAKALELYVNGGQALLLDTAGNVVAGGATTVPGSTATTIGGGLYSTAISASYGVIGGGYDNSVTGLYPTVSGGQLNSASADGAAVGGGYDNVASGMGATISGGTENAASGAGAVVGGGGYDGNSYAGNQASGGAATVAGGMGNTAYAYAAVAGGLDNTAGTSFSAILGGYNNIASGFASMVPGGSANVAGGSYSFAAGNSAQAVHNGAFVWADDSTSAPFASTANNEFSVRAGGGVRFVTGGAGLTVDGGAVLKNNETGVTLSGTFNGNGAGLTNVTATPQSIPPGMALIPAGAFTMGDSLDGENDAIPTVTITVSAFYMDVNVVSLAQYAAVYYWAISHGYGFEDAGGSGAAPNQPVTSLSWYNCVKWSNARSQQAGLTPVYYTDAGFTQVYTNGDVDALDANWAANGYRLPTEAEWEKAARGGLSGQRFPWCNVLTGDLANYNGCESGCGFTYDLGPTGYNPVNSTGGTSPVGYFAANGYGLYDMAGNVCEWCWDWYGTAANGSDDYGEPTTTNPTGPATGSRRILRGGSWFFHASNARCADRYSDDPINDDNEIYGFRCVRGL